MTLQEIQALMESFHASSIRFLNYEGPEGHLTLSKEGSGAEEKGESFAKTYGAESAKQEEAVVLAGPSLEVVTSPVVGIYYQAPGPDQERFVNVGDSIQKEQVIGIVEAMKVMTEIKSPFAGIVEEILVEDGDIIEFGQALIRVNPHV